MNPVPPVEAVVRKLDELPGGEYFTGEFEAARVAAEAAPGQFVHLRQAGSRCEPLLRRPLSIAGASNGVISLLFKKKGAFTCELAGMVPGDRVSMLGPLGHGYDLSFPPTDTAILVAGGYGVAPLLFLAETLKARGLARAITVIEGARNAAGMIWKDRAEGIPWLKFVAATEDGSVGLKGTALDALAAEIAGREAGTRLFACGPMGMLAAIHARWNKVPFQVAVENQMGCGFGVCQGCVLPAKGRTGMDRYVRICREGPVFPAQVIDWEACPR